MEYKYTHEDLKRLNQLPLEEKIALTKLRISEWYDAWGGQACVSFSGGKDSTVLLKLAREVCPDIKAVFCDTGLEYPELKAFVKSFDNVEIIRPEKSFKQVCYEVGYCYPDKMIARKVRHAKRGSTNALGWLNGSRWKNKSQGDRFKKHLFLIDAPFKISDACCDIMKKDPFKKYKKETGLHEMTAMLAGESIPRQRSWMLHGCNSFDTKNSRSMPMAFWKEQDVLRYIYEYKVPICSVYGEVVQDKKGKFSTTGEKRTGCIFCPIGAKSGKAPYKFQRLKMTHPKLHDYILREDGLNMKPFFDFVGIKYE